VVEVAGIRDDVGNGSWPGDGSDGGGWQRRKAKAKRWSADRALGRKKWHG
jgi:hypothetical protein